MTENKIDFRERCPTFTGVIYMNEFGKKEMKHPLGFSKIKGSGQHQGMTLIDKTQSELNKEFDKVNNQLRNPCLKLNDKDQKRIDKINNQIKALKKIKKNYQDHQIRYVTEEEIEEFIHKSINKFWWREVPKPSVKFIDNLTKHINSGEYFKKLDEKNKKTGKIERGMCFAINLGQRYSKNPGRRPNLLVALDVDRPKKGELNSKGEPIEDGVITIKRLLKENEKINDFSEIDTACEYTSSGLGMHLYYQISTKDYNKINKKRIIKMVVNGEDTLLDFLGNDAVHFAPTYLHREGQYRASKWLEGKSLNQIEPKMIPKWLLDIVIEQNTVIKVKPPGVSGANKVKAKGFTKNLIEKNNYADQVYPKIFSLKNLKFILKNIEAENFIDRELYVPLYFAIQCANDSDEALKVLQEVSATKAVNIFKQCGKIDFDNWIEKKWRELLKQDGSKRKLIASSYKLFSLLDYHEKPETNQKIENDWRRNYASRKEGETLEWALKEGKRRNKEIREKYDKIQKLKLMYWPNVYEKLPENAIDLKIDRDFIHLKKEEEEIVEPEDEDDENYEEEISDKSEPLMAKLADCFFPNTDETGENLIKNTVVIKSPMGSGKTYMVKKLLAEHDKDNNLRVLCISVRRSYARNLHNNIKHLGFKLYLNNKNQAKENVYESDRLICQVESLSKIYKTIGDESDENDEEKKKFKDYDLILLDESESFCAHMDSPTMSQSSASCLNIFNFIKVLIKRAHLTICLDANYGPASHAFLSSIRTPFVCENLKIRDKMVRSYKIVESDKANVCLEVRDEIKKYNGRVIVVCCSIKTCDKIKLELDKEAEKLEEENKKIEAKNKKRTIQKPLHKIKTSIKITGLSDGPTKVELEDPDTLMEPYDVVLYTSVVGPGVDISRLEFSKVICCLQSNCMNQDMITQCCSRARNVEDKEILAFAVNLKLTFSVYRSYLEVKDVEEKFENYSTYPTDIINETDDEIFITGQNNEVLYDLFIRNKLGKERSQKQHFIHYLICLLKARGISYTYHEKLDKTKERRSELKKIKKNPGPKLSVTETKILAADDIDGYEYNELCDKNQNDTISGCEIFKKKRYEYKKQWNIQRITTKFLETYNDFNAHLMINAKRFLTLIYEPENYEKNAKQKYKLCHSDNQIELTKKIYDLLGMDLGQNKIINQNKRTVAFQRIHKELIKDRRKLLNEIITEFSVGRKIDIKTFTEVQISNLVSNLFRKYGLKLHGHKRGEGLYDYNIEMIQDFNLIVYNKNKSRSKFTKLPFFEKSAKLLEEVDLCEDKIKEIKNVENWKQNPNLLLEMDKWQKLQCFQPEEEAEPLEIEEEIPANYVKPIKPIKLKTKKETEALKIKAEVKKEAKKILAKVKRISVEEQAANINKQLTESSSVENKNQKLDLEELEEFREKVINQLQYDKKCYIKNGKDKYTTCISYEERIRNIEEQIKEFKEMGFKELGQWEDQGEIDFTEQK